MTTDTLSAVAGDIIATCARTAAHVVRGCQLGTEKLASRLDARFASGVTRRGTRLSAQLRDDLVNAERELTGLYNSGVSTLSDAAQDALGGAARIAVSGVGQIASALARIEPVVGATTARRLRVVSMPSARALHDLTQGVAGKTVALTDRVLGDPVATATRAVASVKRSAARKGGRRAR